MRIGILILMAALSIVYMLGRERNKKKVLVFKALATLAADFMALWAAACFHEPLAWWFAAGIFLYACADVALEFKFLYGMGLFAAGHICLIAGMICARRPTWLTAAVFGALVGLAAWLFRRYLPNMRRLLPVSVCYVSILCLMSAMAVTIAAAQPTAGTLARAVGSLCFVVSDCITGWNYLRRKRTQSSSVILLSFYYLALYLLAAGL